MVEVGRQLSVAAQRGLPTLITLFADQAIASEEGEQVLLAGNICQTPGAQLTLSSIGVQVLDQREASCG